MRKAREESYLPLVAIANLARMRVPEWLAMEAGQVQDELAALDLDGGLPSQRMPAIRA